MATQRATRKRIMAGEGRKAAIQSPTPSSWTPSPVRWLPNPIVRSHLGTCCTVVPDVLLRRLERHHHRKTRPDAYDALDGDRAAEPLDQLSRDAEPQAGASELAGPRLVHLTEIIRDYG